MNSAIKVALAAVLMVACVSLAGLLAYQYQKTDILQDKVTSLTEELGQVNKELTQAGSSCKATDQVVANFQTAADEYTKALDNINANLDLTLSNSIKDAQVKQDVKERVVDKVNDSTDAVLLDSMWQSYCTVQPDDSDCTSRRASSGVPVH